MIRVLCAYAPLNPRTRAALAQHAPGADLVDVTGDLTGYWRAIETRWDGTADLLIVEHDIAIHERVIPQLEACDQPWCVFGYVHPASGWHHTGLGCTRFSAGLQRAVPAAEIEAVWGSCQMCGGTHITPGCWNHVEGQIAQAAEARGFSRHVHEPPVAHYRGDVEVRVAA